MLKVQKRWALAIAGEFLCADKAAQDAWHQAQLQEKESTTWWQALFSKRGTISDYLRVTRYSELRAAYPDILSIENVSHLERYHFRPNPVNRLRDLVRLADNVDSDYLLMSQHEFLEMVDLSVSYGITPPAAHLP